MKKILSINNLSKRFGRIQAVDKLVLEVVCGQVYGILGPNGSGKTTTLGMILDVVAPDEGGYEWFDNQPPVEARKKIGAILETPSFFQYLTAVQNLRITAHIKQCGEDNIGPVLKQAGLYERRNDKFKTYSLGMKQRLSIAAALLSNPPVLILDEPTNGLDPEGIAEVRNLIRNIAKQEKTIIMASHLLDEVQKVCTHFCILRKGQKLHEGTVQDTLGEINKVEVAAADPDKLESVIKNFPGKTAWHNNGNSFLITMNKDTSAADLNNYCFGQGITLKKLFTHTNSLEKEFLKVLKEND